MFKRTAVNALALILEADTLIHIALTYFYAEAQKHQRAMYHYLVCVRSCGSWQPEFDEESKVCAALHAQ